MRYADETSTPLTFRKLGRWDVYEISRGTSSSVRECLVGGKFGKPALEQAVGGLRRAERRPTSGCGVFDATRGTRRTGRSWSASMRCWRGRDASTPALGVLGVARNAEPARA